MLETVFFHHRAGSSLCRSLDLHPVARRDGHETWTQCLWMGGFEPVFSPILACLLLLHCTTPHPLDSFRDGLSRSLPLLVGFDLVEVDHGCPPWGRWWL